MKKEIENKNDEIEKIKVEYGIDDNDIINASSGDDDTKQDELDKPSKDLIE